MNYFIIINKISSQTNNKSRKYSDRSVSTFSQIKPTDYNKQLNLEDCL